MDHVNGDVTDDRAINLRVVSKKINAHNTGIRSTNQTGMRGVSWDAMRNKYRATLLVDGKQHSKRFNTLDAAASWYIEQAKLHGVWQYQR